MELLDVYNGEGKPTGRIVERSKYDIGSFKDTDEYIAVAQIFIENNDSKFLFEKSAKKVGYRYLPAGGHITSGETPYECIVREVKEEIGFDLSKENITDLGYLNIGTHLVFLFYLKKEIDLSKLVLQEQEVEKLVYLDRDEILDKIDKGLIHAVHKKTLEKILETN